MRRSSPVLWLLFSHVTYHSWEIQATSFLIDFIAIIAFYIRRTRLKKRGEALGRGEWSWWRLFAILAIMFTIWSVLPIVVSTRR